MKHYKSVELLLNLNVKPPLHKRQDPYCWFTGDGSAAGCMLCRSLVDLGKGWKHKAKGGVVGPRNFLTTPLCTS